MKQKLLSALLAVVMIVTLLPATALAASAGDFTDVKAGSWYYDDVDFVTRNDYFKGVSETKFDPEGTMTRAMFVTVISRYARVQVDDTKSAFTDVSTNTWYTGAVTWAAENKIVEGVGGGRFAPEDPVTREQMATILDRFVTWYEAAYNVKHVTDGTAKTFPDDANISSFAKEAMSKVQVYGLINGCGDGLLHPEQTSTRAQVAAVIHRLDWIEGYTVTLYNGDAVYDTETVAPGGTYTFPADPTMTGYTFVGWAETPNGTVIATYRPGTTITVDSDITLYAVWRTYVGGGGGGGSYNPPVQQYTITFHNDTYNQEWPTLINRGAEYTIPDITDIPVTFTVPEGKTFLGWDNVKPSEAHTATVVYNVGDVVKFEKDTHLYTVFGEAPKTTIAITLHNGTESLILNDVPVYDGMYLAPDPIGFKPTEGKTTPFRGWTTTEDGSGTVYKPLIDSISEDYRDLYALWTDMPPVDDYTYKVDTAPLSDNGDPAITNLYTSYEPSGSGLEWTITAENLKEHENGEHKLGYWMGADISTYFNGDPTDFTYKVSDDANADFSAIDEVYPGTEDLYVNAGKNGTLERTVYVQILVDGEPTGDVLKITFKFTKYVGTYTYDVETAPLHDEAGKIQDENLYKKDTYKAYETTDGDDTKWTVEAQELKQHKAGNGDTAYWMGADISVFYDNVDVESFQYKVSDTNGSFTGDTYAGTENLYVNAGNPDHSTTDGGWTSRTVYVQILVEGEAIDVLEITFKFTKAEYTFNVTKAPIHDAEGKIADTDLYKQDSYEAKEAADNTWDITVEELRPHHADNGKPDETAYWMGANISVLLNGAPFTDFQYKVSDTNGSFTGEAHDSTDTTLYVNVGKDGETERTVYVQILVDGVEVGVLTLHFSFTKAIDIYVDKANLTAGAVKDEDYTIDSTDPNKAEYTITAKDLKKHANGTGKLGYWMGANLTVFDADRNEIEDFTYTVSTQEVTNKDDNWHNYYIDASDATLEGDYYTKTIDVEFKVGDITKTVKITFKFTKAEYTYEVNTKPAPIHDAEGKIEDADVCDQDTYTATKTNDPDDTAWDITVEGLRPHQNGNGQTGYWMGANISVFLHSENVDFKYKASNSKDFTESKETDGTENLYVNAGNTTEPEKDGWTTRTVYVQILVDGIEVEVLTLHFSFTKAIDIYVKKANLTEGAVKEADYTIDSDKPNEAEYTITAKNLKMHANSEGKTGYWMGANLTVTDADGKAIEDFTYTVSGQTVTSADDNWHNYYIDASDATLEDGYYTKTIQVEFKVGEITKTVTIIFKFTKALSIAVDTAPIVDNGKPTVPPYDGDYTITPADPDQDEYNITISDDGSLSIHENGDGMKGYWMGAKFTVTVNGLPADPTDFTVKYKNDGTTEKEAGLDETGAVEIYANLTRQPDGTGKNTTTVTITRKSTSETYTITINFSAPLSVEHNVTAEAAPIHDASGAIPDGGLTDKNKYGVKEGTSTEDGVTIYAENLKKHKNGENKEGYWMGAALSLTENGEDVTNFTVKYGTVKEKLDKTANITDGVFSIYTDVTNGVTADADGKFTKTVYVEITCGNNDKYVASYTVTFEATILVKVTEHNGDAVVVNWSPYDQAYKTKTEDDVTPPTGKDDHTLFGWSTEDNGKIKIEAGKDTEKLTTDTDLYAIWAYDYLSEAIGGIDGGKDGAIEMANRILEKATTAGNEAVKKISEEIKALGGKLPFNIDDLSLTTGAKFTREDNVITLDLSATTNGGTVLNTAEAVVGLVYMYAKGDTATLNKLKEDLEKYVYTVISPSWNSKEAGMTAEKFASDFVNYMLAYLDEQKTDWTKEFKDYFRNVNEDGQTNADVITAMHFAIGENGPVDLVVGEINWNNPGEGKIPDFLQTLAKQLVFELNQSLLEKNNHDYGNTAEFSIPVTADFDLNPIIANWYGEEDPYFKSHYTGSADGVVTVNSDNLYYKTDGAEHYFKAKIDDDAKARYVAFATKIYNKIIASPQIQDKLATISDSFADYVIGTSGGGMKDVIFKEFNAMIHNFPASLSQAINAYFDTYLEDALTAWLADNELALDEDVPDDIIKIDESFLYDRLKNKELATQDPINDEIHTFVTGMVSEISDGIMEKLAAEVDYEVSDITAETLNTKMTDEQRIAFAQEAVEGRKTDIVEKIKEKLRGNTYTSSLADQFTEDEVTFTVTEARFTSASATVSAKIKPLDASTTVSVSGLNFEVYIKLDASYTGSNLALKAAFSAAAKGVEDTVSYLTLKQEDREKVDEKIQEFASAEAKAKLAEINLEDGIVGVLSSGYTPENLAEKLYELVKPGTPIYQFLETTSYKDNLPIIEKLNDAYIIAKDSSTTGPILRYIFAVFLDEVTKDSGSAYNYSDESGEYYTALINVCNTKIKEGVEAMLDVVDVDTSKTLEEQFDAYVEVMKILEKFKDLDEVWKMKVGTGVLSNDVVKSLIDPLYNDYKGTIDSVLTKAENALNGLNKYVNYVLPYAKNMTVKVTFGDFSQEFTVDELKNVVETLKAGNTSYDNFVNALNQVITKYDLGKLSLSAFEGEKGVTFKVTYAGGSTHTVTVHLVAEKAWTTVGP